MKKDFTILGIFAVAGTYLLMPKKKIIGEIMMINFGTLEVLYDRLTLEVEEMRQMR